jgi:hypothetical protein
MTILDLMGSRVSVGGHPPAHIDTRGRAPRPSPSGEATSDNHCSVAWCGILLLRVQDWHTLRPPQQVVLTNRSTYYM